ncbi:histidine phosphatase family protein [Pseudomonas monteilii]|uniref:histidine phosphatase family protein n=1 Tax=Pseudomonas monteilii TaxID=76759 RepID=UPI003CFC1DD8
MNSPATWVEMPVVRRRCFLVRHGHVDYFTPEGQPLDPRTVSLSAIGKGQVDSLGAILQAVKLDRVICSDYPRAIQTANILIAGSKLTAEVRHAFREARAGRLRDIAEGELEEQFCYPFEDMGSNQGSFLGGERWVDFRHRVITDFESLLADSSWQNLLIVSHDAVNRVLLSWALGGSLECAMGLEQDNACLNVVDVDMQEGEVKRCFTRLINYTPYDAIKMADSRTVMERIYAQMRR